jgi:hypothetical protein
MAATSFYVPLAKDRFRATDATVGPWDSKLQHGSPPAALLARTIERSLPRGDARIAEMTFAFLGPVPVGELAVDVEVLRPGARVERSRARLSVAGRAVLEATAWRIAVAADRVPRVAAPDPLPPLPGPQEQKLFPDVPPFGYGEALEWRFAEGAFDQLGPATVWSRARIPLLEGEELSPICRLLIMVDSANGLSAELPLSKYMCVPVELYVSLQRHPRGEWVAMRARTSLEPDGVGLTRAELFDEEGFIGVASQTLFAAPR